LRASWPSIQTVSRAPSSLDAKIGCQVRTSESTYSERLTNRIDEADGKLFLSYIDADKQAVIDDLVPGEELDVTRDGALEDLL
jgi:hypothetical protein